MVSNPSLILDYIDPCSIKLSRSSDIIKHQLRRGLPTLLFLITVGAVFNSPQDIVCTLTLQILGTFFMIPNRTSSDVVVADKELSMTTEKK